MFQLVSVAAAYDSCLMFWVPSGRIFVDESSSHFWFLLHSADGAVCQLMSVGDCGCCKPFKFQIFLLWSVWGERVKKS